VLTADSIAVALIKRNDNIPILAYPVPANGSKLRFAEFDVQEVTVFNSSGVPYGTVKVTNNEIDISALPNGTYYARIPTSTGFLVKPFIIVR
ncbi:MAG: T9SS type A sorting domain-containing protein, partial [Candidatus Kapabacteria bacterium]|nr:T9SS type A sorting domain-containing protein [Candidatus Kapabacteria bacterium]